MSVVSAKISLYKYSISFPFSFQLQSYDIDSVTLIHDFDLDVLMIYMQSKNEVSK